MWFFSSLPVDIEWSDYTHICEAGGEDEILSIFPIEIFYYLLLKIIFTN